MVAGRAAARRYRVRLPRDYIKTPVGMHRNGGRLASGMPVGMDRIPHICNECKKSTFGAMELKRRSRGT